MSLLQRYAGWRDRISSWFVDREFFMRANGQVRFLKISARLQRRLATAVACVIGLWIVITLGMAINQVSISFERLALVRQQAKIQSAAERVSAYRGSIDEVTKDLKRRQDMLESMSQQHFGANPANAAQPAAMGEEEKTAKKISMLVPEAAGLAQLEARQIRFAIGLTAMAEQRAQKAAAAIRTFGLNPDAMAHETETGMGGPFIPFFGSKKDEVTDPRFTRLADALERMDSMERALAGIPTSMPAAVMMMTSNFGYRRDPFTGAGAMHAGLDFRGPIGTPILAAADGVVSYAAVKGGYGNCVEITHANGLVTRYGHLSRINVSVGQQVQRGVQIANMGSTGRSTGPHLHFEVRLNDQAINPINFLEANHDVLEVQAVAGARSKPRPPQP